MCHFCRNSSTPMADIPEINSRIALRTIGKSLNDECDEDNAMIELTAPLQLTTNSKLSTNMHLSSPLDCCGQEVNQFNHPEISLENSTKNEYGDEDSSQKFCVHISLNSTTQTVKMERRCVSVFCESKVFMKVFVKYRGKIAKFPAKIGKFSTKTAKFQANLAGFLAKTTNFSSKNSEISSRNSPKFPRKFQNFQKK